MIKTKQAQHFHSSNHPIWLPYQILGKKRPKRPTNKENMAEYSETYCEWHTVSLWNLCYWREAELLKKKIRWIYNPFIIALLLSLYNDIIAIGFELLLRFKKFVCEVINMI